MKISHLQETTPASMPSANPAAPKFGRDEKFLETSAGATGSGGIASVSQPVGGVQRRGKGDIFKGIKTSKKFPNTPNSVKESEISENDLIITPGQGRSSRTGFVKHDPDRAEHEGHTLKNSLHTIIRVATHLDKHLSVRSEFPEWVSEKIGATKSMMVNVMDYVISSQEMQHEPDPKEGFRK